MTNIIRIYLLTTFFIFAESDIELSLYDKRMGTVTYNPNDVIVIYAKEGYLSIIEFDDDEKVLDGSTGFNDGWEVKNSGNTAYIMAKPYMSSMAEVKGENEVVSKKSVIQPNATDWATNLFIRTNKRVYLIDLRLSEYRVNYKIKMEYPSKNIDLETETAVETAAEMEETRKRARVEEYKFINQELGKVKVPKNWDYHKIVNAGSSDISPNYVYDDGTFTYFGFDRTKKIPSIFLVEDGKEFSVNSHIKKNGRYSVKIVQKTGRLFYFRSGDKLVGIKNSSYGVNPTLKYNTTNNPNIKREIR